MYSSNYTSASLGTRLIPRTKRIEEPTSRAAHTVLGWTLIVLLIGYWSFGKTFAYLGLYPIYIGEVGFGVALAATLMQKHLYIFWHTAIIINALLLLTVAVQGIYSHYTLNQPTLEIARNLTVILYSVFGFLTWSWALYEIEIHGTSLLRLIVKVVRRSVMVVLIGTTISAALALSGLGGIVPFLPSTQTPLFAYKPEDTFMPLAVVMILAAAKQIWPIYGWWAVALALVGAALNRSAMICLFITVSSILIQQRAKAVALVLTLTLMILALAGLPLEYGQYRTREVSVSQYLDNVESLIDTPFTSSDTGISDPTIRWRWGWWSKFLDDSASLDRVLIGNGWGANLAVDYGMVDHNTLNNGLVSNLRNPHNAFLGILGRGGWLAAGLWSMYYAVLLTAILKQRWRSRRGGGGLGDRLIAQIMVTYAASALVNGATDVFLESPQNAIPLGIVLGLALAWIHANSRMLRNFCVPKSPSPRVAPDNRHDYQNWMPVSTRVRGSAFDRAPARLEP